MDKHPDGAKAWSVADLGATLTGLVDDGTGAAVSLVLADVDAVRALTMLGAGRLVSTRHTLVVARYRAPLARWRGRVGHLVGLLDLDVRWPEKRTGRLSVEIRLDAPSDIATVAAAVMPLLLPSNSTEHVGSPLVAVAPGAPTASLALLELPWAVPPQHETDPAVLEGNDVVLIGAHDTDAHEAARTIVVERDGRPEGAFRPVVDLAVHNPIRRQAKIGGATPWRAGRLVASDGSWRIVADEQADIVVDPARPLTRTVVEKLRLVAWLDLGALAPSATAEDARALAGRLAELAATGVVLHGGAGVAGTADGLAPELAQRIVRTRAPRPGLETFRAAVDQRRVAMREHAGRFALSSALTGGAPELPNVTVLLVTNRPNLVEQFLERVAAQTYPHLDVVVVMHGVQSPDPSAWEPRLRGLVSATLELDPSTSFGDALARATARADGPLVLKMDDDDLYGPEFVWDLVLARAFSGAQVVGKQAEHVYLEPYDVTVRRGFGVEDYSEQVAGGTMLASVADIMAVGGWRGVPRSVDRALMQRVVKAGGLTYVDRGVGFVYVRHGRGHTWNADASHFLRNAEEQWHGVHLPALGIEG